MIIAIDGIIYCAIQHIPTLCGHKPVDINFKRVVYGFRRSCISV